MASADACIGAVGRVARDPRTYPSRDGDAGMQAAARTPSKNVPGVRCRPDPGAGSLRAGAAARAGRPARARGLQHRRDRPRGAASAGADRGTGAGDRAGAGDRNATAGPVGVPMMWVPAAVSTAACTGAGVCGRRPPPSASRSSSVGPPGCPSRARRSRRISGPFARTALRNAPLVASAGRHVGPSSARAVRPDEDSSRWSSIGASHSSAPRSRPSRARPRSGTTRRTNRASAAAFAVCAMRSS